MLAGDRKVYAPTGARYAQEPGVKHVVVPKPGKRRADRVVHEAQRWFRQGRNWRVGMEGRMSVLKRRHKLRRCRYHGADGMERWVGWGIIAHTVRQLAQATQYGWLYARQYVQTKHILVLIPACTRGFAP